MSVVITIRGEGRARVEMSPGRREWRQLQAANLEDGEARLTMW